MSKLGLEAGTTGAPPPAAGGFAAGACPGVDGAGLLALGAVLACCEGAGAVGVPIWVGAALPCVPEPLDYPPLGLGKGLAGAAGCFGAAEGVVAGAGALVGWLVSTTSSRLIA
jgi:hypothetical protein